MAEVSYYLCRLCAYKCVMPGTMVFSAEGLLNDIPRKIQECLQLTVRIGHWQSLIRCHSPPNWFSFLADIGRWQVPKNHMPWLYLQIGSVVRIQIEEFGVAALLERYEFRFVAFCARTDHNVLISFQNYSVMMCWVTISSRRMSYKIRNFNNVSTWATIWPINRPFRNSSIWSTGQICKPTTTTFRR